MKRTKGGRAKHRELLLLDEVNCAVHSLVSPANRLQAVDLIAQFSEIALMGMKELLERIFESQ